LVEPFFDLWAVWHVLFGAACGALRLRWQSTLALAFAWEWVEAVGWGLVGADPSPVNSLWDVSVALLARWAALRICRHGGF